MSTGVFGSIRPAILDITRDVDIYYTYKPTRGETDPDYNGFKKVDNVAEWLNISKDSSAIDINGLYNLKLPLNIFNKKGFYTIYITPKVYNVTIIDVSVLATYPDIKGIVLKTDGLPETDITGYRIEYQGNNNGMTRLIKSSNSCEPVIVNTGDGYPKTTRYNLTADGSNLLFCTVSPSSAPTFKPNATPFIGAPGEEVKLINTKFTPKVIEVETVTHDMDTLSYMLEGDQTNDRDNAIITTYNDKKEIYHQSDYYVLKDKLGKPKYTVRKKRVNIDTNQNYENIIED